MVERKVSADERDVVRWLLVNAATQDVSEYRAESLEEASVVSACSCGCACIDFVFGGGAAGDRSPLRATSIIAEAYTLWPDGTRAGVMLWGTEGRLLGVELYELGGGGVDQFPTVQALRRWETYVDDQPTGR
jgi:hypothetical protein